MKTSETIVELASAFAQFQAEVSNPKNTAKNPQYRSKYAPLDEVINTVKPVLARHGLSFLQSVDSEGESITVTTLLMHSSGEWIQSDPLTLPAYQIKSGGAKDYNAQGAGSALTYARRYSLSAMLGISSEDDDDANGQSVASGYKDKDSNAKANDTSSAPTTDAEREKLRQEAMERAKKAREAKTKTETTSTEASTDSASTSDSEPKATEQQLKAINNLLDILEKKVDKFDRTGFILEHAEVSDINNLPGSKASEFIKVINATMRAK